MEREVLEGLKIAVVATGCIALGIITYIIGA